MISCSGSDALYTSMNPTDGLIFLHTVISMSNGEEQRCTNIPSLKPFFFNARAFFYEVTFLTFHCIATERLNLGSPIDRSRTVSLNFRSTSDSSPAWAMASLAVITNSGITPQEIEFELVHWNDDRGALVITITTIFIVCATIAVVLRLITRRAIIKIAWQLDDYAITLALIISV